MRIDYFSIKAIFAGIVFSATNFPVKAIVKAEFNNGESVTLSGSLSNSIISNDNTASMGERGKIIIYVYGGYNYYRTSFNMSSGQYSCTTHDVASSEFERITLYNTRVPKVSNDHSSPRIEFWCPNFDGGNRAFHIYRQSIPKEPDPVPVNVCRMENFSDVIDFGQISSGKVNGAKSSLSGWLNCDQPSTVRVRFFFSDGNDWMSMGTDLLAYLYVGTNTPGQVGEVYNVGQYHSITISAKLGSRGNTVPGKYSKSAVLEYNIL